MCDFGPRPFLESFDLCLDVRSVLFVLPTSSIQGALRLGCCRRSRSFCWAASSARPGCVTRCSVRPILEVPRYPPLMAFRTTDTSSAIQRSQHLEWPLCVESRCDAVALGSNISVSAPFVRRCLTGSTMSRFHTRSSNRTGRFPASGSRTRFTLARATLLQLLNIYRS